MAITATNIARNHRGVYFEFTGDGVSTQITVPHGNYSATRTAKAFCLTGGSNYGRHSGFGGFHFPSGGTSIASTATSTDGTVVLTTGSAVGNGTLAQCVVIFDADADA